MISLTQARSLISALTPHPPGVRTELRDTPGLYLLETLRCPEDIPAFDRSAMDGYALNDSIPTMHFELVGEVRTGSISPIALAPGQCARIFTGGPTPQGTTRVAPQEHIQVDGSRITVTRKDPQTWIRHRGEDAKAGSELLVAGTLIGPGELSILAGIGITRPLTSDRPRVIHFTTGNEIVPCDQTPQPGQIRDSNSTLIEALLHESGARMVQHQHVEDSLDTLTSSVAAIPETHWDMLLISGGASVGDYDFGAKALEALGFTIHFRKLNLRPGKPLIFGTRNDQVAFVIPGNPVSHFVTYHIAIDLALSCLKGNTRNLELVRLPLAADLLSKPDPRETWWPAQLKIDDGHLKVAPIAWQSSGDIKGLASANALIKISPDTQALSHRTLVECLLLDIRRPLFHSPAL
ncbi:MAG: molybdopterin molybdotransferase MoeA [Verrucomicrobiota bacterium]